MTCSQNCYQGRACTCRVRQDYAPRDSSHTVNVWAIAGYGLMTVAAMALPVYVLARILYAVIN